MKGADRDQKSIEKIPKNNAVDAKVEPSNEAHSLGRRGIYFSDAKVDIKFEIRCANMYQIASVAANTAKSGIPGKSINP